jgi:hypothetical protein
MPIRRASWFAYLAVRVSTIAAPTDTAQKGRVSLTRFGLPFRSHAQRLRM